MVAFDRRAIDGTSNHVNYDRRHRLGLSRIVG